MPAYRIITTYSNRVIEAKDFQEAYDQARLWCLIGESITKIEETVILDHGQDSTGD